MSTKYRIERDAEGNITQVSRSDRTGDWRFPTTIVFGDDLSATASAADVLALVRLAAEEERQRSIRILKRLSITKQMAEDFDTEDQGFVDGFIACRNESMQQIDPGVDHWRVSGGEPGKGEG